jgi:hypothetical protein
MKEIMKDKNLLTEITRIREMMGVRLLSEQPNVFIKSLDNLLTLLKGFKGISKFNTRINKLLNTQDVNGIKKLLDDIKADPKLNINVKKAITKFEQSIVSKYNDKKYTNIIQQGLKNGETERQITAKITNNLKQTYGDFADGKILDDFTDKLSVKIDKIRKDLAAETTTTTSRATQTQTPTTTPRTEETDLSSEIPDSELVTTEMGPVPKIFKVETWNSADFVNLSDESIELLINQPFWERAILYFQKLFTTTNGQLRNIQKLGKALETTTDASLMVKLERKLKTELESLYRKNTNNFVNMRKYFDSVALQPGNRNWARIWRDIKGQSNGGWDFYKTFGSINEVPLWEKFWEGITDNLKVLFETEAKYAAKISNRVFKTNYKPEMIGNFLSAFKSGSRRGFPSLNNKQYEKLIQEYGPGAAKFSYFRDLVVTTLKWSFYIGTLKTVRNALSYLVYQDDITPCAKSGDRDSKECNDLINDVTQDKFLNWFRTNFINWAIQYKAGEKVGDTDIVKSWGQEILNNLSPDIISDTIEGDKWYKTVGDIASLDMGWVGDVFVGMPTEFFNIIDNPLRRESLINAIDKNIETAKENLEKSKLEVEDEVKQVIDRTQTVVDNIDDSEPGFRLWCQKNNKEFVGYNVDGDGLGRTKENGVITTWLWNKDTKTFDEY